MGTGALRHGLELLRGQGVLAAARHLPDWLSDRYHERKFGIATGLPASLSALGHSDRRWGDYAAPTYRTLKRVLRFFDVGPNSVFLDYGCGRGRAMVVASTLPFAKVIGVDIVRELLDEATANLKRAAPRLRCRDCELIHADAAAYVPPPDVDSIYFFNPFRDDVLEAAVRNIESSLRRHPRPLTIAYLNADQFSVMARKLSWLELVDQFDAYPQTYTAIYRARPERLGPPPVRPNVPAPAR